MNIEYFDCACYSPEHTVRWIWDEEFGEIECEFFLHHHEQWYKRLWQAIKYVFGQKSNVFCGFILRHEDFPKFKKMVNEWENFEGKRFKQL